MTVGSQVSGSAFLLREIWALFIDAWCHGAMVPISDNLQFFVPIVILNRKSKGGKARNFMKHSGNDVIYRGIDVALSFDGVK
uniref:Uncharacterized protein n=1 Tax=Rhizophora mucronata TaxID=61149 RepID=A0A2P2PIU1_RHIMU